MRIVLNIVAALFLVTGIVWILQGINVIPGSFMTGQSKWSIYGALSAVIGIALLIKANSRRARR